jgi:SPP1 family phage portal protein
MLDEIITLYSDEGIAEQDMNAALYQSIFGRAVMLVYINAEGRPITKAIDPRFCFAVCDESVEENLLFFVYMTANNKNSDFLVYTDDSIYSFEGKKVSKIHNVFGKIPVIEIKNNINDVGDFEPIITLIDAYNKIGSDRVNDREQFSDSLLVLRGVSGLGEDEESEVEEVSRMREQKILALPDSDATAEWLTKPNEGKDVELLRNSMEQDIHKLSQTPNFSDGSFGGNNSGVAIRYKLFGFDNRTRLKEAYMRRGLQKRLELYAIWLNGGRDLIDGIDDVIIHFTRRLPVDEAGRAKALKDLDGLITPEAIKDNSPFQEDNNR